MGILFFLSLFLGVNLFNFGWCCGVFCFLFFVFCCGLCCFWSHFGCWVCLVLGYGVVICCLHDLVCFVFFFWGFFFFFKGYGLCGVSQPIDFHYFWGLWGCGV